NRGNAKAELERYQDALADYDKAIELSPEDFAYFFSRGEAKKMLRRHTAASEDFKRALTLAQEQRLTERLQRISREPDDLRVADAIP
ncbi:MAG: tetratricopeptide repeat protein, partial [Caldilineaceae bacterium SB0665_bin_25]|nr:tetratricopeptide repeat protein [Caldilineaceae bacterium SB0665_bin_25]